MYVDEYGPEAGVPIVFLHGSMVAGWMWMGQVEDLPEYRCLLPDLPGIGRSGRETWTSFAETADRVAEMILDRCPDGSAHLVGLSLGGIIGLHVAARHPERVRSVIVSGVPYGTVPLPLRLISRVMLWLYGRAWGARLVARVFGIPDEESFEAFVQTADQTDLAALRTITAEVYHSPLPADLGGISMPVLAVVGEKDTAPAKRAVLHIQDSILGAATRIVPGVGHQWNAEDQALFSAMVRSWVDSRTVDERLVPPPERT